MAPIVPPIPTPRSHTVGGGRAGYDLSIFGQDFRNFWIPGDTNLVAGWLWASLLHLEGWLLRIQVGGRWRLTEGCKQELSAINRGVHLSTMVGLPPTSSKRQAGAEKRLIGKAKKNPIWINMTDCENQLICWVFHALKKKKIPFGLSWWLLQHPITKQLDVRGLKRRRWSSWSRVRDQEESGWVQKKQQCARCWNLFTTNTCLTPRHGCDEQDHKRWIYSTVTVKFPGYQESFQAIRKVFRLSGKIPGYQESF